MPKIPVTREGKKGSEILLIPSCDIVKIECIRDKEYMIHTLDDAYYYSTSLDAFEELLYEDGFRLIDQTNLVNLNYVRQYDSNKGIVWLEDPSNSNYKTASAARIHKDHILNVMEMIRITKIEKDQGFPRGSDLEDKLNQMVARSQDDRFMRSYSMIQAIYERTRAEKLLKESEQRYKSLQENNPDAICSFDLLGQFISVNPATERITGYPADELLHKSIIQMILPSEIERWTFHFQRAIQGETQTYEITFIHKNGLPVNLEVINVPIVVNEKIAGVYAISKDITEKKQAEYLLIKSEKLSIVGQLAAGLAHEIRNPLTSLMGFVQLLKDRAQDYNQFFDIMQLELDRINFIVSEFLVIAKPQVVQFELRDITNILNSTISFINTQAILRNVDIIPFIQEEFPPILCDENQIKQVFINVLNNSIDAMPDGGEIIIKAQLNEKGEIVMTFIDQGVGIPDERISRLGEPFYTTKEKGTGLGLMVSYKIIENHNGHLNIQSKVGKGTVVSIILPAFRQLLLTD